MHDIVSCEPLQDCNNALSWLLLLLFLCDVSIYFCICLVYLSIFVGLLVLLLSCMHTCADMNVCAILFLSCCCRCCYVLLLFVVVICCCYFYATLFFTPMLNHLISIPLVVDGMDSVTG
mmetsp:Transcript_4735/g.9922  ORF Transcript_4735/g.9922 Transcript_4735/m.9922 type:complete len:119 (+) Transcript_4735:2144-2500(+)